MPLNLAYKASAEQFGPRRLLDYAVHAEQVGLRGRLDLRPLPALAPPRRPLAVRAGLARRRSASARRAAQLGTSVLTPTMRYEPAVVAHAFGTLACLNPGRVILGVGSGEAMNETPVTGRAWPGFRERSERLAEAVELIRRLWTEERVTFEGKYYRTERATIYDRPEQPVPIWIAAGGPKAAQLVGRLGDGFICTSGKGDELYRSLLDALEEGARAAGRDPAAIARMIEIKVSYDRDRAVRLRRLPLVGGAGADRGAEERGGGPDRDGAPGRRERRPRPHALHRLGRSRRGRRADRALRRARASRRSCSTPPATTRSASSTSSPPTCSRACARAGAEAPATSVEPLR